MLTQLLIGAASLLSAGFLLILAASLIAKNNPKIKSLWSLWVTVQVVIAVMVIPAAAGIAFFFPVISVMAIWSQKELLGVLEPDLAKRHLAAGMGCGGVIMASALFGLSATLFPLPVLAATAIFSRPGPMKSLALSLLYPVMFSAFAIHLYQLEHGPDLFLLMYAVSEVNNSFAQLMGKIFGKRQAFPYLSPNKTRAGVAWGIIFAFLTGLWLCRTASDLPLSVMVPGLIVIIFFTIAGDLFPSWIKRKRGVKDFGTVLPHHGGVLDICDAVIFTAPFFFLYALLFVA